MCLSVYIFPLRTFCSFLGASVYLIDSFESWNSDATNDGISTLFFGASILGIRLAGRVIWSVFTPQ